MPDPVSDTDKAVCWHCGGPADPDCVHTVVLNAPSSKHCDGQGYPVVRGRNRDVVEVLRIFEDGCQEGRTGKIEVGDPGEHLGVRSVRHHDFEFEMG
jgi:hypothetical protein